MPDDSQTPSPFSRPLAPPVSRHVRVCERLRRPMVRDVFFVALSPAVLTLLWSGYEVDRTSLWWLTFLVPFSVALLAGFYGALRGLFGNARADLGDGLRSAGSGSFNGSGGERS